MAALGEPHYLETADGVRIAVHDLGGSGEPLLVAHATGFHGRAYAPFAKGLQHGFRCEAIDERGHGLSGLPHDLDFDWNGFALDVLAGLSVFESGASPESGPFFGFGHSAGATALLIAEVMRPGTFRGIYCFEPVVFPSEEPLPLMPDNPLSAAARRRRDVFPSREAAFNNYRSKPPLETFDEATLRAYVEHGFEDLPDGSVRLLCRPENEAAIYASGAASGAYRRLCEVACPVVLAGGAESESIPRDLLELVATQLPRAEIEMFDGIGHFGPLEDPLRVAASVGEHLLALLPS
jgi:pimeloyl-ACP methyl ester carboxylesterase